MLHHAAFHNCEGTVQLLLKKGASPMAKDIFNQTPLHMACAPLKDDTTTILEIFLEVGADPSVKDCNGKTPLHMAARTGDCDKGINFILCDPSVDLMARNREGNTALHLALEAAGDNKFGLILELCLAGSDPYIKNNLGKSAWDTGLAQEAAPYTQTACSILDQCVRIAGFYDAMRRDESSSDSDFEEDDEYKFDFSSSP
ncbi:hypothetical protein N7528_000983 [Penicillium herquei]|nr:hypothetical protein N7528_000983 [Penicillium herquei]